MSKSITIRQAQHTVRLEVVGSTAVRVSGPEEKTNFVKEFIGLQNTLIFWRGCGSVHLLQNKLC